MIYYPPAKDQYVNSFEEDREEEEEEEWDREAFLDPMWELQQKKVDNYRIIFQNRSISILSIINSH